MISPRQTKEHIVTRNNEGIIIVDGKEYPMAEDIVATESVIQQKIKEIAKEISNTYKSLSHLDTHGKKGVVPISDENPLIIISILKGSYIFTADLVRYLGDYNLPHVVDFIRLTSYRGTQTTGQVELVHDIRFKNLNGKHILLVEDIADRGHTLNYIINKFKKEYQLASLKVCVLADKPKGRVVPINLDYICLTVPNKYVIGYGFEVNDRYRNFRHIFTLKPEGGSRYPSSL